MLVRCSTWRPRYCSAGAAARSLAGPSTSASRLGTAFEAFFFEVEEVPLARFGDVAAQDGLALPPDLVQGVGWCAVRHVGIVFAPR